MVDMYGKLARKMLTPFFSPHFKMKTRQNVTSFQYHVLYRILMVSSNNIFLFWKISASIIQSIWDFFSV